MAREPEELVEMRRVLRATVAPQLPREADIREVAVGERDQVVEQLVTLLCGLVGAMNRRELIQSLGWAVGTLVDCA